ncbi:MAG: DUF1015 domain-containing protein [Desulfuromonas sp.]|uniref:DUF1015 domain-containing protein n=1 Tax=Desulfuromonas sp. TaxID=892 RepID=UPI000CAF99CC|nr:DUF1015 domain-containing protein [Desulfuromonas sp.]PLX85717.1 MAG: DUF1015 domain-containing protein [Desulfuromonas sp.]
MAKIVPFRGVRYNPDSVKDLSKVMAPPYDVISPELQDDLYARHPANVVRLILGKTSEEDGEADNRYTRAAADFEKWQEDGALMRDAEPSVYLYDQEYPIEDGTVVVRKGFMALTRIEDFSSGVVKPHEKTLSGPKTDRLNLTKACGANFSPIFSLYSDPCCALESLTRKDREQSPALEVSDDDGVKHRLWRVTDPASIEKAQELLSSKPLFIADGHHRYETALNFRNLMREKHPGYTGKELFNYVLMYFANMEDQGMLIFPTHRMIFNLEAFHLKSLLEALGEHFLIDRRQIDSTDPAARAQAREELKERGRDKHVMGLFAGDETLYFLTLKDEAVMDSFFDPSSPKVLRTLDVSILHKLILEGLLDITPEAQEKQVNLKYVKNFDDPFDLVQCGEFQLAFLMNSTRMSEVRDVANAGEKMPQKSTYFYPKLLTGLVINKIAASETVEG